MIDLVKRFFMKETSDDAGAASGQGEHDVRVATCALFVEMARLDRSFTPEEVETILALMQQHYDLAPEHAKALLAEADRELSHSVDLWQFARLINDNYSIKEKLEIIETLWRMVFVDGKMDKYEDYMMTKLRKLLRLSHRQVMEVKMKVLRQRRDPHA